MNLKDLINILIDADKKQENNEEQKDEKVLDSSVAPTTEKVVEQPKVDERDKIIEDLKSQLASRDAIIMERDTIISERDGQIKALKELTSVNSPANEELSLQEIIQRGEF